MEADAHLKFPGLCNPSAKSCPTTRFTWGWNMSVQKASEAEFNVSATFHAKAQHSRAWECMSDKFAMRRDCIMRWSGDALEQSEWVARL